MSYETSNVEHCIAVIQRTFSFVLVPIHGTTQLNTTAQIRYFQMNVCQRVFGEDTFFLVDQKKLDTNHNLAFALVGRVPGPSVTIECSATIGA